MADKKLNILFVCEQGRPPLEYLRAFAQRGHRFKICTDADRAMREFDHRHFEFDVVVVDTLKASQEVAA